MATTKGAPSKALTEADLRAVCALWTEAFPTAPDRDRYAEALARRARPDDDVLADEWIHSIVDADGNALAAARTFVRVIRVDGEPRRVLALAHVASSPRARGAGHGAAVVRLAFQRLRSGGGGDDLHESIFCSGVPAFYLKLGATQLPETLKLSYPSGAKPFHDPAMLRYALETAAPLPAGAVVDVNGDGW
ncbi:hypothetical protein CTAYLR_003653 [Chrysophaeum taylorii]|uniref:N-acetyltransferase domain-containing protein n=1 Tax=Chrysophaeum taylorii TaxID=2483200 RepID=A0AAD7XL77_9STRA|nr:hypothetical protein CTAYLR_003653 [Chrysophaeum taylorii]